MDNLTKILLVIVIVVIIIVFLYFICQQAHTSPSPNDNDNFRAYHKRVNGNNHGHDHGHDQERNYEPEQRSSPSRKILVLFSSPSCGYCRDIAPVWDELMQNFNGVNDVQIIKLEAPNNQDLFQFHKVQGYPTIKFCPYGLENDVGMVYQGERTLPALIEFLRQST